MTPTVDSPANEFEIPHHRNLKTIWWYHSPNRGWLIQVDIGGRPLSPTGPKQFSNNFGNLLFLAVF
jgi:hypothetical protein